MRQPKLQCRMTKRAMPSAPLLCFIEAVFANPARMSLQNKALCKRDTFGLRWTFISILQVNLSWVQNGSARYDTRSEMRAAIAASRIPLLDSSTTIMATAAPCRRICWGVARENGKGQFTDFSTFVLGKRERLQLDERLRQGKCAPRVEERT